MVDRTYDWNGHKDLPISYPHLSDEEMAGRVRMLFRDDLSHECVVCGARDRIMCLSKELTAARAEIERLRDALQKIAEGNPTVDSAEADAQLSASIARSAIGLKQEGFETIDGKRYWRSSDGILIGPLNPAATTCGDNSDGEVNW